MKSGSIVEIILNTKTGTISYIIDGQNFDKAFSDLDLRKPPIYFACSGS